MPRRSALAVTALALLSFVGDGAYAAASEDMTVDGVADRVHAALGRVPGTQAGVTDVVAALAGGRPAEGGAGAGLGTVTMEVGSAVGAAGAEVSVAVTLDAGGLEVTAVQLDVTYDPLTPVKPNAFLDPDCAFGPTLSSPFGGFSFVGPKTIRAIVLQFDLTPIADGSVLFTCNVAIAPGAPPATYPLSCSDAEAASPPPPIPLPSDCSPGAITVEATPLDHFACYKIKREEIVFPSSVSLADQFGSETVEIKKGLLWCSPVSKNGEPIANPADHLLCYKIKGATLATFPKIQTTNQFGVSTLFAKKPFLLCVPGSNALLP